MNILAQVNIRTVIINSKNYYHYDKESKLTRKD